MKLLEAQRIAVRLGKAWTSFRKNSGQIYVEARVPQYRSLWRAAAESIGATFTEISEDLWEIEKDGRSTRVLNYLVEFDTPVMLNTVASKPFVKRLLSENGVPVPDGDLFTLGELGKAYDFLASHPDGCVVKPANATSAGRGITTHLVSRRALRKAAVLASLYGRHLMVEAHVKGETCRGLVLNGRMIHAVRRSGPRLLGDGSSTVRDIIEKHNGLAADNGAQAIPVDIDCLFTLSYQDLTLDTVPGANVEFVARSSTDTHRKGVEVRTAYNEDITNRVGAGFRRVVERVGQLLGAEFVGVDLITQDIGADLETSGGAVLEVNATPGLHHHYDSSKEPYPQAAVDVLKALLNRAR